MTAFTHPHHPFRIFAVSGILTLILLAFVAFGLGPAALVTTVILLLVELTFSFDNAIINAKVLNKMSPFWRTMFMTVGIVIAVFGMRVVFPVLLVMITAGLSAPTVIDLALNQPHKYSEILIAAHPLISGFGGAFLMMLGLTFFLDQDQHIFWIKRLEKRLQSFGYTWVPTIVTSSALGIVALITGGQHGKEAFEAGCIGIVVFLVITTCVEILEKRQQKSGASTLVRTGMAGFATFLYLEVLDASFSFDGVLGALAITQNVVLIAAGLGAGALWIRSLTLFMVRRGTLHTYQYLEHGAHYTILLLSLVLFGGLLVEIPEWIPGLGGVAVIAASVIASRRAQ